MQPSRPKKLRNKDPFEKEPTVGAKLVGKLTRKGEKKKCSLCGQRGHNKVRCKKIHEAEMHVYLNKLIYYTISLSLSYEPFHSLKILNRGKVVLKSKMILM